MGCDIGHTTFGFFNARARLEHGSCMAEKQEMALRFFVM